jgi:hypothetical protein
MKCFDEREFKNYWFETGTPTFLVELYKKNPVDLSNLCLMQEDFSVYEPDQLFILLYSDAVIHISTIGSDLLIRVSSGVQIETSCHLSIKIFHTVHVKGALMLSFSYCFRASS